MHNNTKTKVIDPNKLFERLRIEVIEQLGYDAKNLRPWQTARVHSLALLHLEMDRMTSEALQGRAVDPKAVAVVGEQLERLLNPSCGGDSPESRDRADEEANAELERLIDGVLASREREASLAMQNEELAAQSAAMPVSKAPETLSTVDNAQPPSSNVTHPYLDIAPDEPLRPPAQPSVPVVNPARFSSLGNPNSQPTPRTPKPLSPYDGLRQYDSGGIRSGKSWSVPDGF